MGGVAKCWLQSRGHHDQGQANFGLTAEVHSTMAQLSAASSQMNLYGQKCEGENSPKKYAVEVNCHVA